MVTVSFFALEDSQDGDAVEKYIRQMYLEHREAIYRFALSKTEDHFMAEDVVQTVFQRLTRHLQHHDLREIESFIGYAIETARHVLSDMWREGVRPGKSNVLSLDDELNVELRNSVIDERATRAITEHIEIEDRLLKSVADATPIQRQIIVRRYKGLSPQEIAEVLGVDVKTVRIELNRVMARLRYRVTH